MHSLWSCYGRPWCYGKQIQLMIVLFLHSIQKVNVIRILYIFIYIIFSLHILLFQRNLVFLIYVEIICFHHENGIIFEKLLSPVSRWKPGMNSSLFLSVSVRSREPVAGLQRQSCAFGRHPHPQPVWSRVSINKIDSALT